MSDGPMLGRLRVSTLLISERRDTVYDGSRREENPLDERTAITSRLSRSTFGLLPDSVSKLPPS